jgi:ubiquinone/menaquinone biosynthesis C-methylase UbiE
MSNKKTPTQVRQKGQMGKYAPYYDLIMASRTFGREKSLRQMEIKLAKIMPGDNVLEIGCGTGTLTLAAKAQAGLSGEVVGMDIAPEMVAAASKKAAWKSVDVSFLVGSIADIPFQDNHFNEVLCSFMIYHIGEDARMKGFKEIFRVLRPGGHLTIIDDAICDASSDKRYGFSELVPVLQKESFTDMEMGYIRLSIFWKGWFLRAKVEKK